MPNPVLREARLGNISEGRMDTLPGSDPERLFMAGQPMIRQVVAQVGRRYRLSPDETEELQSDVMLKLFERDYAVLRKFEGRSSLRTYLTIVVRRLALDRRVVAWGKWRSSAQARRMGPAAVYFQELTGREGLHDELACALVAAKYGSPL